MSKKKTTINLGNEHDLKLRETLTLVLREMGANIKKRTEAMAGSQDLEVLKITIRDQTLILEIETYIGISLTGEQDIIEEIVKRIAMHNPS